MAWLDQFYSAGKTHGSGANGATPLRELGRRDIAISNSALLIMLQRKPASDEISAATGTPGG
jgi:hypothetical protein